MRAIATDSVAWSVCVLVTTATPQNAETVEMPFGGADSHGSKVHSFATWRIRVVYDRSICVAKAPGSLEKNGKRNRNVATVIQRVTHFPTKCSDIS